MTIISLEDIGMSYGPRCLFEGVTLGLDDGDKVGLIGLNGSGKSTLLRIIAGHEQPDKGRAIIASERIVAYLPQNPPFDQDQRAEQRQPRHRRSEHDRRNPAGLRTIHQSDYEQCDAAGGAERAQHVERAAIPALDVSVEQRERQQQSRGRQGGVDQEHRSPPERAREDAAEQYPDDQARPRRPTRGSVPGPPGR